MASDYWLGTRGEAQKAETATSRHAERKVRDNERDDEDVILQPQLVFRDMLII